ncbi:MAG: 4Fe-4S binding protein [Spirochaetes bacterium]|nr:4Fe-4S binding protein [Spirochaetota bacterium]
MKQYLVCRSCGYKKNFMEDRTCPNCSDIMIDGEGNKNAYFENKMKYPSVDSSLCTLCGKCISVCAVSAIYNDRKSVSIFIEKCTNCGRCISICPENAISR